MISSSNQPVFLQPIRLSEKTTGHFVRHMSACIQQYRPDDIEFFSSVLSPCNTDLKLLLFRKVVMYQLRFYLQMIRFPFFYFSSGIKLTEPSLGICDSFQQTFLAKYLLYTTVQQQLQFHHNWLIRLYVSAVLSCHHQAYRVILLIKVHSTTLPMGFHCLHWTLKCI